MGISVKRAFGAFGVGIPIPSHPKRNALVSPCLKDRGFTGRRDNENLEEAKKQLLKASAAKGCILKILVRTKDYQHPTIFDLQNVDDNLLVIDSHEIVIDQWLMKKQKSADKKKANTL